MSCRRLPVVRVQKILDARNAIYVSLDRTLSSVVCDLRFSAAERRSIASAISGFRKFSWATARAVRAL